MRCPHICSSPLVPPISKCTKFFTPINLHEAKQVRLASLLISHTKLGEFSKEYKQIRQPLLYYTAEREGERNACKSHRERPKLHVILIFVETCLLELSNLVGISANPSRE